MLSRTNIRTRLLAVAAVPAAAFVATTILLGHRAPAGRAETAAAVAVLGLVASVVVAVVVARTITAPLRRLGEAAERASHLPSLVQAQRRTGSEGREIALAPVGLPPGGEIGGVARAFDALQGAAARMAAGQAALLDKTAADKATIEVLVGLVRRVQSLVDHQIDLLDALEAEEQDPGALEKLFRLDRLATSVHRNAGSLMTLASTAPARRWERPLAMSDVIRAGMAEVDDIGRVDLVTDGEAAMLGNVAADAAHMLSELLENAIRSSPPHTRVEVSGKAEAGGYVITIEGSGNGMTGDVLVEANHVLTGPPLAEATVARSLGLVVAGRLARRLGIDVRLASAGTGGLVATVVVPPAVMVAPDPVAGLEEIAAGPVRDLPLALARQERRARLSSQRSRPRPRREADAFRGEASITQPPITQPPITQPPITQPPEPRRPDRPPEPRRPDRPPEPDPAPTPPAGRAPVVRPARFAASSQRAPAGAPPTRQPALSAEAKEDEYRRHLDRATAAGLVRRVPKASLPQDAGAGPRPVAKPAGDQSIESLPDEVRRLLSSPRSGVQRRGVGGPDADRRTTAPEE